MYRLTVGMCCWGVLALGICSPRAVAADADSASLLGYRVARHETTIQNLDRHRIVGNRLWIRTKVCDSSGRFPTFEYGHSILDPATLEVLWAVEGNLNCHPTCYGCVEPCLACETMSNISDPDTIFVFDMAGNHLHQQTYPPDLLSSDGISPPTTSSPHGQYFYISWCSGFDAFSVHGRDGQLLFDSDRPNGNANEAYAFSDSLIMIPMHRSADDPYEFYENSVIEVLSVPEGALAASITLPPSYLYGDAALIVSPSGGRAIAYSHVGQVSMIGPNLTVSWSARLLQHVSRAAFSIDGRYLTLIGRDTAAAIDGPLKLVFVSSDSGRVLWSRLLPSGCDNHLPAYEPIYLTGRVIRVSGRDFTLLVHFGSNGEWIAEECSSQVIDLIATDTGYITILRSNQNDQTLISNTWHVSR